MANKKKIELTLEDRIYIQENAVGENGKVNKSVDHMAAVIAKPKELIEAFIKELYPNLEKKEEPKAVERTAFENLMGRREGITIMTEGASSASDDIKKRPLGNRMTKNAIHRPKG